MAEICKDCWDKLYGNNDSQRYLLSKELDYCESCGQYARVIVRMKTRYLLKDWFCDWVTYLRNRRH